MEWEVRFTGAPNSAPNYAELLDENTATKILKDPWVMNHFSHLAYVPCIQNGIQ